MTNKASGIYQTGETFLALWVFSKPQRDLLLPNRENLEWR